MTKSRLAVVPPAGREQLKALNPEQSQYLEALKSNDCVIAIGKAGTGKTFMPAAFAADLFISKSIKKLILCRPAVSACGENLGFLPGDLEDKVAPWAYPIVEILKERLGKGNFQQLLAEEKIEFQSFQHMRGRTFNDAFIMLDEAQNTTPEQMQLFLMRTGDNSRVVITGDLGQADVRGLNGLQDVLRINERAQIASVVELKKVERSELAARWADAYEEGA